MRFPKWQADTITALLESKSIKCVLLLIDSSPSLGGIPRNLENKIKFSQILARVFFSISLKFCKAAAAVNLSPLLNNVPSIKYPSNDRFTISPESIKRYKLDFILNYGSGKTPEVLFSSADYGVWEFRFGSGESYGGNPPCFWEIYNNEPVSSASLQRVFGIPGSGIVLREGHLNTSSTYPRNLNQVFNLCIQWPYQVCVDLMNNNSGALRDHPAIICTPQGKNPSNIHIPVFLIRSFLKTLKNFIAGVFILPRWNIGIVDKPVYTAVISPDSLDIHWCPLFPKDGFYADPFFIEDNNKLHIFFEEYSYKELKGHIAYTCYVNGKFSPPRAVITEPFHLSYPYLFTYRGSVYMVPECSEKNTVYLYAAEHFPWKWERINTLIDDYAGIDSTIFSYNGYWWLFSSDLNDGPHYNLKLFYSDNPLGNWRPHPQNPVKSDVRSSRPAGTPFIINGELYRPAMNNTEKYGAGITINKILTLDKSVFKETVFRTIYLNKSNLPFSDRIHTVNGSNACTVVDGSKDTSILTNIRLVKLVARYVRYRLFSKRY